MFGVQDSGKQFLQPSSFFLSLTFYQRNLRRVSKKSNEPGREKMCLFRIFWSRRRVCFCCWNNLSNRFLYLLWFKTNSDEGIYITKSLSFVSDQNHFILGSFKISKIFCSHSFVTFLQSKDDHSILTAMFQADILDPFVLRRTFINFIVDGLSQQQGHWTNKDNRKLFSPQFYNSIQCTF